jgi:hypothetical protein
VKPFFESKQEEKKMAETTSATTAGEASTATTVTTDEFRNIPLDLITVEKQIRTNAGVDDEASQGLKDSIAAKGLNPSS